jgi:hypothetical protein
MARTSGCRSRTWGQEAPENNEEACGVVSWLGGGRSLVVNGNPLMEEEAIEDGALPSVMGRWLKKKGVATPSTEVGGEVP